jgi:ribose transport system substrate-binding protein
MEMERLPIRRAVHGLLAALCAAAPVALAACGSSSTSKVAGGSTSDPQAATSACPKTVSSVTIDGTKIAVTPQLHLAVFWPFTGNADIQGRIAYLNRTVPTIPCATMTQFDGQGSATTQLNQIQDALQSGKYNAAIAAPIDGQLTCQDLSKQAAQAGWLVAIPNLALCGRGNDVGPALRAPGTLTYVGGTEQPDYWRSYLTWIAQQNPGPQQVLALTDPPAPFPLTTNFQTALDAVQKAYPNFKVVGEDSTDLTVAGAFQKMTALIQAHPSATVLITMFSTETQGAVQALQAAGKLGKIKIYDKGTTPWAAAALRKGTIVASSPERAVTSTATMLQAILNAREGKPYKPYYDNDGAPNPPGSPADGFTVFTQKTIGNYAAQN